MIVLFIGGSLDGLRREVDTSLIDTLKYDKILSGGTIILEEYKLHYIRGPQEDFCVYGYSELTLDQVLKTLLAGYEAPH